MKWMAKVYVTLKSGVLDPQGKAVSGGLLTLGYTGIDDVRVGKYIEIVLSAPDGVTARNSIQEICEKLLANPIIEEYHFEVSEYSTLGVEGGAACATA